MALWGREQLQGELFCTRFMVVYSLHVFVLAVLWARLNCHILHASSSSVNYICKHYFCCNLAKCKVVTLYFFACLGVTHTHTQTDSGAAINVSTKTRQGPWITVWKGKPQPLWHLNENASRMLFVDPHTQTHIMPYLRSCNATRSRYN